MRTSSVFRALALALAALPGWALHRLLEGPSPAAAPAVDGEKPAAPSAAVRPAEKKDACVAFITCNGIYE